MKRFFFLALMSFFMSYNQAQSLNKLGLIFDSKTYHFGDIEQWNNQPAIFTFTNKSKLSLTILPLFTENDLDVIIPDKPIKPGESVLIKAIYYTDGKGPFSRSFPIYFGSRAEPVNLKITGNIKSLSPEAYIKCPMAKPELSKPRIELVGDIAELDSEFPISGSTIQLIGLQNKKELHIFSNSRGRFGAKLPTGNYLVKVSHPNYESYTGTIFLGQTSPPLRIRLKPIGQEPLLVENVEKPIPVYENRIEKNETLESKNQEILTENHAQNISEKVQTIENHANYPEKDDIHEPLSFNELKNESPTGRDEEESTNLPKENTGFSQKENQNKDKSQKPEVEKISTKTEPIAQPEKQNNNKPPNNNLAQIEQTFEDPQKNKDKIIEKDLPANTYTFRIIDKNTLLAIEEAHVFIADFYDKKNRFNEKTNIRGIIEVETKTSDYRILATADGYISNEIRISKDDQTEIYKVFLTPVSSLYDEIYESKKEREKENEALLSKLSFGKTNFSFAQDDEEVPEKKPKETQTPVQVVEPPKQETIVVEKIVRNQEKEDSLKNIIAQLEAQNAQNDALNKKQDDNKNIERREKLKLDSLNNYIEQLLAKNNAIKENLDKVKEDKQALENEKKKDQAKIDELQQKEANLEIQENLDPFSLKKYQANNIMFLIDVSTSMGKGNKIELLKESIKNLVGILREVDRVAIITYNQKTNTVLQSISGDNKDIILSAIDSLKTGGLTNGVRGITTAYDILDYYFIPNGNNQIILATDGLFSEVNNELNENELNKLVKKQAEKNMKLTVVGFGKDQEGKNLMSKLAKNGNGQFIQISNEFMTKDILIREIKLNSEIKH